MKKFTVERANWGRGYMNAGTAHCAMGFYARSLGYTQRELFGTSEEPRTGWCESAIPRESRNKIIWYNDEMETGAEREFLIAAEFAKHSIQVEYV